MSEPAYTNKAMIGFGTATTAVIAQWTEISGSGWKVNMIEVTNMASPGKAAEFIAGKIDGGDIKIKCIYDKTSYAALYALLGGLAVSYTVTAPDGGLFTLMLILQDLPFPAIGMEKEITVEPTFKVTGKPTFSAGS